MKGQYIGTDFNEVLGKALVKYRWEDEQGRRCTRFICETYGNRVSGTDGGEEAKAIAEALNAAGREPPEAVTRVAA